MKALRVLTSPRTQLIRTPDDLDRAYDRVVEAVFKSQIPETLSHYTDWKGLEGILTTRELWGVDFRKQDTDPLEFQHAEETILRLAQQLSRDTRLSQLHRFTLRTFASEFKAKSLQRVAQFELFITSFCSTADNPKVWRDFGRDGAGFALEFEMLRDETFDHPDLGVVQLQVDYDLESVRRRVGGGFLQLLDKRARFAGPDYKARYLTQRALWMIASYACTQCKSQDHAQDCEWRRVVIISPSDRGQLVHDSPKRHVKVPVRMNGSRPALRAIHIGSNAPPSSEEEIEQLLTRMGYAGTSRPKLVRRR